MARLARVVLAVPLYVELNPVKAGMVKRVWDYRWNSVHAYLSGEGKHGIIQPEKLLKLTGDWKACLREGLSR